MTNEDIQLKIARMFNMGDYGDRKAMDLLHEYAHNLADELRQSDYGLAADEIDPWG